MSTRAQAILEEIKSLPPTEVRAVCRELQHWLKDEPDPSDPIRSARGMFAGGHLTEALLASRLEDNRHG